MTNKIKTGGKFDDNENKDVEGHGFAATETKACNVTSCHAQLC